MGLILTYQEGQTPLDPEQINGLKIKTISTQQQLTINLLELKSMIDLTERVHRFNCLSWVLIRKSVILHIDLV